MKLTTLSEKAMLVKLTIRRVQISRRDDEAEAIIQQQLDDHSLTVMSRLFRDKQNPVNGIMTAASEVYTYHKTHTLPYVDKGPRILPNSMYMEYTQEIRQRIAKVDRLMQTHLPNYDQYVQQDIAYRSRSGNGARRAKVEDYPTATEFQQRMGFDLRFMPLPDRRHFLFDLSEEDEQQFEAAMQDAVTMARNDAIVRMLKPLKHLVDKLETPIGAEGSVFRDSAIENVIEGIEIARKLNLDDSPEITETIRELTSNMAHYADRTQWLRESPIMRAQAADQLKQIADKMGAWMNGV